MNGDDELSLKDITFLRAIRDINGSPERYGSTEQGVTPATVTAITEATTLSEEEVTYRLDHPRLGSGLVNVYEAEPPGDDSASLNSAELTEAGERAIAEAEDREASVDAEEWRPDEEQSEFDDMQEWEPAEVESGSDVARAGTDAATGRGSIGGATAHASADPTAAPPTESPEPVATSTTAKSAPDADGDDRIAALEERIERLEAETTDTAPDAGSQPDSDDEDRVDELAEEVASLRETTDRLESTLDRALDDLDAIRGSEYGALDEKREAQFETAVKSMVAFHQLATEVLDVRVENYEPSAGHADPERVEITRNRIGDALGVGKSGGGGGGRTIEMSDDDGEWPDPEEAAAGSRVFSGEDEESDDETPEPASDAPEPGVYPPIGEDDSARETADDGADEDGSDAPESGVYPPIGEDREDADDDAATDGDDEGTDAEDSEAPDSGVYPPIGEDREDGEEDDVTGAGALPDSVRPDTDDAEGNITETAAEEGHVVDPIRSTDDEGRSPPMDVDPEAALPVRRAVVGDDTSEGDDTPDGDDTSAGDTLDDDASEGDGSDDEGPNPWRFTGVDPTDAHAVREAVVASDDRIDDPYPEGEAYARIVDEPSVDGASTPAPEGRASDHAPAADDDD